jgi:hypothetical protein
VNEVTSRVVSEWCVRIYMHMFAALAAAGGGGAARSIHTHTLNTHFLSLSLTHTQDTHFPSLSLTHTHT